MDVAILFLFVLSMVSHLRTSRGGDRRRWSIEDAVEKLFSRLSVIGSLGAGLT